MSLPGQPVESARARIPEDLAEAGFYATAREGFEHGLVVLAMGQGYWLMPDEGGYRLLVEPQSIEPVRDQLSRFDRESIGWPPLPADSAPPARQFALITPLLWALSILAVFWEQNHSPGRWEDFGAVDARAIFHHGEWWRLGTALFLHADLEHLLSNLFFGVFVFSTVLTTIGRGRGWLLLAAASIGGNLAAAALNYSASYHSLGASTAIFAGLGLLTGRAVRALRRGGRPHPWRGVWVPLAAGVTLLALYGAGGREVDAVAHVTGFAAGLALGTAFAYAPPLST